MTEPTSSSSEMETDDNNAKVVSIKRLQLKEFLINSVSYVKVKRALFQKQMSDAQQKRLDFLMQKAELFAHFVSDPQCGNARRKGKK